MYLKKKMRVKLILLAIVVVLFLYWRGVTSLLIESKGWNCQYQVVYALCQATNNKATLPGLWDILKAGIRF
ncbi:MAG: hypothetical protein WDN47_01855 [Candidatus Doudnabacteria bacterium]